MGSVRGALIAAGLWNANDARDPTEDIAAAWSVVEAMAHRLGPCFPGYSLTLDVTPRVSSDVRVRARFTPTVWMAGSEDPFTRPDGRYGDDVSRWFRLTEAPLAICEAAFIAIKQQAELETAYNATENERH